MLGVSCCIAIRTREVPCEAFAGKSHDAFRCSHVESGGIFAAASAAAAASVVSRREGVE